MIIKVYRKKNYVVTIQPDIRPDVQYPAKKIGRISGGRISGNSVSGATLPINRQLNKNVEPKIKFYTWFSMLFLLSIPRTDEHHV